MSAKKELILSAYKRTSRSNKPVLLTDAEMRVLKLLGLRNLNTDEKRDVIRKSLNEAWSNHNHK
jgi:hypothetical protein